MEKSFDISTLFDTIELYKTWEEIPMSTLWFKSNSSQLCFIAIDKEYAVSRLNECSLPANICAYEYKDNIRLKPNEVILQVELDTSNMLDTTNLLELKQYTTAKPRPAYSLIRTVQPVTHLGCTNYIIVYQIRDNRAVKNIQKI